MIHGLLHNGAIGVSRPFRKIFKQRGLGREVVRPVDEHANAACGEAPASAPFSANYSQPSPTLCLQTKLEWLTFVPTHCGRMTIDPTASIDIPNLWGWDELQAP
jgi:hypothetical protein